MYNTQEPQQSQQVPKQIDKGNFLARLMIVGDTHLSVKDYGQHYNYPEESYSYFVQAGQIALDQQATHLIYTGDLTYGRFTDLEYREKVDQELERQNNYMNGNLWIIKGNHDKASYGMTEYEYYLNKGLFKGSETLHIGRNEFLMTDFGKEELAIPDNTGRYQTIVIGHNWFTFEDMQLPPNVKHFPLDHFEQWFGIQGVISGHIHQHSYTKGFIRRTNPTTGQSEAHKAFSWQLSCWARPQYLKSGNPTTGDFALIDVYEKGYTVEAKAIQLWPLEKSFNMAVISEEAQREEIKEEHRIDMTDIIENLTNYTSGYANPEDIIMGMAQYDIRYRQKAIEYLKQVKA